MASEVGGIEFQDTAELRAPSRNHSFLYSYFRGWEKMWRRKKINLLLQLEMEVESKAAWNESHYVSKEDDS